MREFNAKLQDELSHHGIKGQKWGIRRTPEELGHKNLKKAKMANIDEWGKTSETNVLYISGVSGSGKSTVSSILHGKNVDVIHLDLYYENFSSSDLDSMCPAFNKFLTKNKIKFPSDFSSKKGTKEYGKILDNFAKAVEDFGKEQFHKNRKVIAEGVQVADGALTPDNKYFKDKPVMLLHTNSIVAMKRAFARDGRGGLLKGLSNLDSAKNYIEWYKSIEKSMTEIEKATFFKRGKKWLINLLEEGGKD